MKNLLRFRLITGMIFLFIIACQSNKQPKTITKNLNIEKNPVVETKEDSLFLLDLKIEEKLVTIKPSRGMDFSLPDSSSLISIYKQADFNADSKDDIMVDLGACGTGGCMYGLFLNQSGHYYKLVFLDYLKNPDFIKEENGFLSFGGSEEVEPYNPTKLNVTTYKFNPKNYQYELDTSYLYIEEGN